MNSFNNIRGGKRKSKSKSKRTKNKQKGGNTGYFLDLESPTMGGLNLELRVIHHNLFLKMEQFRIPVKFVVVVKKKKQK